MGNSRYKFRAWDSKEREMHYFGFDDLCGYEELAELGQQNSGVYLRDGFHFSTNTNDRKGELCPWLKIMQFTGLLDMTGKEIYEGDVVKCLEGYKAKVEWGSEQAFYHPFGGYEGAEWDKSVQVLGNIYEHPDLLK